MKQKTDFSINVYVEVHAMEKNMHKIIFYNWEK